MTTAGAWLPAKRRSKGGCLVLCFPQAGGTGTSFFEWTAHAEPELDLVTVRFPGRGVRLKEPPLESMDRLVEQAGRAIGPTLPERYYVLGQCLGGVVAYEFARYVVAAGHPRPAHCFIIGCGSPDTETGYSAMAELGDAELVAQIRAWGGTAEGVLTNPEMLALILSPLRSDFRLLRNYRFVRSPALDVPLTACRGRADCDVSAEALGRWEACTTATFRPREFDGGHFLEPAAVMAAVREEVRHGL